MVGQINAYMYFIHGIPSLRPHPLFVCRGGDDGKTEVVRSHINDKRNICKEKCRKFHVGGDLRKKYNRFFVMLGYEKRSSIKKKKKTKKHHMRIVRRVNRKCRTVVTHIVFYVICRKWIRYY